MCRKKKLKKGGSIKKKTRKEIYVYPPTTSAVKLNLQKAIEEGHWRSFEAFFKRRWGLDFRIHGSQYDLQFNVTQWRRHRFVESVLFERLWEPDRTTPWTETEINQFKKMVYRKLLEQLDDDLVLRSYRGRRLVHRILRINIKDVAKAMSIPESMVDFIEINWANIERE